MSLAELDQLMPEALRRSSDLFEEVDRGNRAVGWFRVSAFPIYAETAEQLDALLEQVTPDVEEALRERFRRLLRAVAEAETAYVSFRGRGDPAMAERLRPDPDRLDELGRRLTETSSADVYIPKKGMVLVGHDDFGCQCFFHAPDSSETWIRELAGAAGLHCVRPARG